MVGDDRVRLCKACDREVFDLSRMSTAEAEALLARRGITPCVRFYRRADGTVMTADCPTGARRSHRLKVVASTVAAGAALAAASPAAAEPEETPAHETEGWVRVDDAVEMGVPVYDSTTITKEDLHPVEPVSFDDVRVEMGIPIYDPPYEQRRPRIEWSSWVRLGYGTTSSAPEGAARSSTPPPAERTTGWEAALGADVTIGVAMHGDLRLGAWAEARTSSGPVLGGELILEGAPDHLDLFQYAGEGVLALRAGGNREVVTTAIAYGYLAPWRLWGPWNGRTRYMIGVRFVASATRSVDDPRDWSATAGLELEPIGAIRYLLGVRAWY